jgi:transcriptional antiterminator NusG
MINAADDEFEHTGAEEQPLEDSDQPAPASPISGEYYTPDAEEAAEPDLSESDSDSGLGAGAPLDEPAPPADFSEDGRNWFVIHCYSGYENKVRHNLEQRIESMGMKGKIFDVVVPTEEEIEVKDGKRRTVERRVFPGYLLVQMIMSEESRYVAQHARRHRACGMGTPTR